MWIQVIINDGENALPQPEVIRPTPQSLTEAIHNSLSETDLKKMQWHIKDFLAQKFTVALCCTESEGEHERLMKLFEVLTCKGHAPDVKDLKDVLYGPVIKKD